YQINARRFDASGTARGGSFPVTDFPSTAPNEPSLSMDAAGDFVVSWTDGRFMAQRFDSAGAKVGDETIIATAFDSFRPAFGRPTVAMDYDGDFVAAFMNGDNADYDIYARQYG